MSTSPDTHIAGPYVLTGSGQTLSVPFFFLKDSHLLVKSLDSVNDSSEAILANPADYTVTGAGNELGGSITMVAGVSGQIVVITRLVPITQIVDYIEGDGFPAATHEQALDKLTMINGMIAENLARCIQFPVTSQSVGQALPPKAATLNKGFLIDSAGNLTLIDLDDLITSLSSGSRTYSVAAASSVSPAITVFVPTNTSIQLELHAITELGYYRMQRYFVINVAADSTLVLNLIRDFDSGKNGTEKVGLNVGPLGKDLNVTLDGSLLTSTQNVTLKILITDIKATSPASFIFLP